MGRQELRERVEHNLSYHKPKLDITQMKMDQVRTRMLDISYSIIDLVPDGREQSVALTKIEEACMWAIAGLARNEQEV